jgi:hypothetical protein
MFLGSRIRDMATVIGMILATFYDIDRRVGESVSRICAFRTAARHIP